MFRQAADRDFPLFFSRLCAARCIFLLIRLNQRPMNDAQVKEIQWHFGVVAETLRSDICQVAEDHSDIRHEIHELHKELRGELEDMRALMWDCKTLFFSPSQQAQS